jgi:hypothetical protein
MTSRRRRQRTQRETGYPFDSGIVLGRYDGKAAVPAGCVVYGDRSGDEWLIYDPALRASMAEGCPICEGEDHGHGA